MRLLERIKSLQSKQHAQDIASIYSAFGIRVNVRTEIQPDTLANLYDALSLMCQYYDIEPHSAGMSGLRIVIEERVYDGRTFFNRGVIVDGLYTPDTNLIHLTADRPNALVHEFIHAVDQAFRPERRGGQKSFIDADAGNSIYGGLKDFIFFLRSHGVPERDITDFQKTYDAMCQFGDGYLRMPAEVIARMGEYSFWSDNREECEGNPFLRFSCSPYYMDEERKAVNRFPFHGVMALRHFVHHAVREISGKAPKRWVPDRRTEFLTERSSEWYKKAWYMLDDADGNVKEAEKTIRYQQQALDKDAYMTGEKREDREAKIRNASQQISQLKKTRTDMARHLAIEVGDSALNRRISALYPDGSKVEAVITYLRECQTVARLREQELQTGREKRKERER